MIQEFFGKPFWNTLVGFTVLFALSILGYFFLPSLLILVILGLLTCVVTFRKLEYGLMIAFLELLSNAHGYILFSTIGSVRVSARMIIFLAVFLGWGITLMMRKSTISWRDNRIVSFVPLLVAVVIGGFVGIRNRSVIEVFQDGNAYLFLLYLLPILSVSWDSLKQRVVLQMFAAATVFTTAASLYILYAFTHLSQSFLRILYVYLRDIRFAEMTHVGMGMYRIFEQTQIFAIVFGFILLERVFRTQERKNRWMIILLLSCVFTALLVGMSRSFLFGLAGSLFVLIAWLLIGLKISLRDGMLGIGSILMAGVIACTMIYATVIFPFPHTRAAGEYLSGVFGERAIGSDVAVSSRWNLLSPMIELVKEGPVFGNGFGQPVTFITDDPRIRAIHPDGSWTTTSMEWGWLELWIKMGILGPLSFLTLFVYMTIAATMMFKTEKAWVGVWVIGSSVFLYLTHFFSPYLNHPIGIGLILVSFIFLPGISLSGTFAWNRTKQKMPRAKLATSIVTSKQR